MSTRHKIISVTGGTQALRNATASIIWRGAELPTKIIHLAHVGRLAEFMKKFDWIILTTDDPNVLRQAQRIWRDHRTVEVPVPRFSDVKTSDKFVVTKPDPSRGML